MYVTLELEKGGSNIENAEFPSLDPRTVTGTSNTDKTMSQAFPCPKCQSLRELPQQQMVRTLGLTPTALCRFGNFCSCSFERHGVR